jgi:hypothetical protein
VTRKGGKARKPRVDPAVVDAWRAMFEDVFLKLMQGIVKATSVEVDFADLEPAVRQLTQQEMHRISSEASVKFVDLAYSALGAGTATEEQLGSWKRVAIEHALRRRR